MDVQLFHDAVGRIFGRKGEEVVKMNIEALEAGYDFAVEFDKNK
jgi:Pyruvate/2-oxoacid:ferredoxin oxidoreductase gamma subunit